jgi:hypothetical protein
MTAPADTLGAVRWFALLLVVSLAGAQDAKPRGDDHDKYGFPITFDAEVITLNDLVRDSNVDSIQELGNIGSARDQMLMDKLTEKVGELYGLEVEERAVSDVIERQIAAYPSEAEFYESLAQKGQTLELFRQDIKRQVLAYRLNSLITGGFLQQGGRLLPWDPNPSPREVKIAFDNDPARIAAGSLVKWRELAVSLSAKERKKVYGKRMLNPDLTDEDLRKEENAILEPRVARARAALKAKKSLDEIAKELGATILEKAGEIDSEPSKSERLTFLQKAKKGEQSGLLAVGKARYAILQIVEVRRPDQLTLNNPKVVEGYRARLAQLKQSKANFTLRLRALEKSIIRPERVRRQLRDLLLTSLRQSHRELRVLGLH